MFLSIGFKAFISFKHLVKFVVNEARSLAVNF